MRVVDVLRQVFGNPDMRRVQGGWLLSITAEWVYLVNLLVLAYVVGGVVGVGVVGMLRTLPAALLGPLLATLADRLPRQQVLLGVHLARCLVVLGMALVALGELPAALIFAAALLEGSAATLNRATTFSLMPGLARTPQELVASNVSISLSEGFGVLAGPALGGLLVVGVGPGVGLLCGSIGFGLAALAVLGVRPAQRISIARPEAGARLRELTAGLVTLRAQPHVGLLVGLLALQTFVRGILTVLIVAVAVELLLIGEGGVGFLNSAIGAGGLLGSAVGLSLVMRRSLAAPLLIGLAFWGIPIAAIGLFPLPLLGFGFMVVIGASNAVLDISAFTVLQRTVPNKVRGRVLATLEGAVALTVGLGSLVAPLLVVSVGLQGALVATGCILPVAAVLSVRWVRAAEEKAVIPERELHLLRGLPVFAPLPLTILEQLCSALQADRVPAGTEIVRQGEAGDSFYVIAAGSAEVLRDGRPVARLSPGEGFGEIALLRDVPRTATVRASSDIEFLRLGRRAFVSAVCGNIQSLDAADAMVGSRMQALGDEPADREGTDR